MRRSHQAAIFLVFLTLVRSASGLRWISDNTNFEYCYNNKVKNRNTSDLTDSYQYFLYDHATGQRIGLDRPLITYDGCQKLCGDGYEIWDIKDTALRLVLWLSPSLVLVSHYHFAPLSGFNKIFVVAHLLGDPIDSIWSMLTSQEVNRRLYRKAATSNLPEVHSIATVWSAYNEIGWQDASDFFFESLKLRTPEANRNPQDSEYFDPLDDTELYFIALAAQRLTSNRSESQFTTWVAIGSMFGALAGAYVRTWSQRTNNQTSHTIAVVTLLFIFIPLVKISGNIGAFTSSTAVIDILQELRRNLHAYDQQRNLVDARPLFPALYFHNKTRWDGQSGSPSKTSPDDIETAALLSDTPPGSREEIENLENWPKMARYLGMNACWRPFKRITTQNRYRYGDRNSLSLFVVALLFVVGGSYAPSLCLAYFTPLKGFACRSLAWTLIMAAWVISVVLDVMVLKPLVKSAKLLWRWTILKDAVVSSFFIATVFFVQVGTFNSCFCRSGELMGKRNSFVDLNPLTEENWTQGWFLWIFTPPAAILWIFFLIWWVTKGDGEARRLLNRNLGHRQQDIIHNNNFRMGFRLQPMDIPPAAPVSTFAAFDSRGSFKKALDDMIDWFVYRRWRYASTSTPLLPPSPQNMVQPIPLNDVPTPTP